MRYAVILLAAAMWAQSPFEAAPEHYKLEFENPWVRVSRVSYLPHESAPEHEHPALNVVYVYLTDSGPLRFRHDKIGVITRPPVKAGQIRFARGAVEKHTVEYLGDIPTEYLRVELKTKPVDTPDESVRLAEGAEYQNGQVRIVRAAAPKDPAVPAVLIALDQRTVTWHPAGQGITFGPGRYIRIELKSEPVH